MRVFQTFAAIAALLAPTCALRAVDAEPAAVFSGSQGNYAGFIQTGDGNFLNAGIIVVVVQATGTFSANLTWQGYRYPFVGKFNTGTSTFSRAFKEQGNANGRLALSLVLDPPASRTIQSTLDIQVNASTVATATGELSGASPDATAGQTYQGTTNTAFIDHPNYGETTQDIPGDGFAISRVSKAKSKAVRVIGRLPDTVPFASGSLLRGSIYSLYTALYRKQGRPGGNAYGSVDASDPSSLFSTILWAKRPGVDADYYAAGFNTGVGIITGGYKNVTVRAIPHISAYPGPVLATLTLKDGNLASDITAQIKIGLFGVKVFAPNPQRIALRTSAAGANWVGSFIHPATGKRITFHGGFSEAKNGMNGEGRGNFKGSVPENSFNFAESGSARITVNP